MESERSSPVQIALINASAHVFGAEKSMALLVRLLAGKACSFLLISPGGACEDLFRRAGVAACRRIPLPRFYKTRNPIALSRLVRRWAIGSLRVYRIIRQEKPDIVHANGLHSVLYALLARALLRRPLVWHVRDLGEPEWALRIGARFADALIAPSLAGQEYFVRFSRNVCLVPNPAVRRRRSSESARGIENARRAPRRTPSNGEVSFRIGLVGQMISRKGHRTLLDALPRIESSPALFDS
ncbi:MAG: glycosyltransferase [Candidatus Sumerlaeota bacterium]|nr:glycosyltransferase [Candidatus Sumerlaeota bacterium]